MEDREQQKQRRPETARDTHEDDRPQPGASSRDNVHGEGNYKASREFDEAEREFVQSGKLDEGIRNAAPKSETEKREMEEAEERARRRAKEEDPALLKKPPEGNRGRR